MAHALHARRLSNRRRTRWSLYARDGSTSSCTRRWLKMAHFGSLKKDVTLAMALAAGANVTEAAEQARVSRRTATRKLADPAFRQLVAEMRADFIAQAVGRLTHNMTRAADALAAMLDST